ncbi:MAG: GxxExxY protein [bacterium]
MPEGEKELLYREEVFKIVGAAIEVHKTLGAGFLEAIYQEALEIELRLQGIPFESQKPLPIQYKNYTLAKEYIADMICMDKIILELKALNELTSREEAQLLNYLKATGLRVGLLINFGKIGKLEWKRFIK